MLAYYCKPCTFYYRELELTKGKTCPECKAPVKPRMILGGQIMGAPDLAESQAWLRKREQRA